MSFFRVSEPNSLDVSLFDLGIIVAANASNVVLSDQFGVQDLLRSADMESAIIAGDLTVQIDYGTGFTTISAAAYTNRDCLAAFLNVYEITNENNNEDLVDGSEASVLHHHDSRYYTESELGATTGGALIGVSDAVWTPTMVFNDLQEFIDDLYTYITGTGNDLDATYDADADGILNVDGTTKPLIFRSDGSSTNDIVIQRKIAADIQDFLRADISANQLLLGMAAVGALAQVDVRVLTNLIVDGNITFTGTITDTTVQELNVTNADIRMRTGAASGADANIFVERGSDGADASIEWNEAADRWKAGVEGSEETIALLERDETVSGTWLFDPTPATDPVQIWDERAAPTTALGGAGQTPVSMFASGVMGVYDKSNSRNKWLSVSREHEVFTGRSNANNSNEYAYVGLINSFETGLRLERAKTLLGISAQTQLSETWTARVRKNGVLTNLASLAITAATGAQTNALNVDFAAGDVVQVYIDGTGVSSPVIKLEFADNLT
jgi:hypothetical protein